MRIASVRSIDINCSILVFVLFPLSAITFGPASAIIMLVSLSLHEFAHTIMAHRLGCRVCSIEIQPFGFIARLYREPASPSQALAIALSGPAASITAACCAKALIAEFGISSTAAEEFAAFNLSLTLVNLFPALPLDGGRAALAMLERSAGRNKAIRLLAAVGFLFGICLCAAGVILILCFATVNISIIITGLFIMLAAYSEQKKAALSSVGARLRQRAYLSRGGALRVNQIAINANASISSALALMRSGGYNMLILLDDYMRFVGYIGECELINAATQLNQNVALIEAVRLLPEKFNNTRPQLHEPFHHR